MTKYNTLINILDAILREAPTSMCHKYPIANLSEERLNQARSRAFIHLYLKVSFGLLDFEQREHLLTDGAFDGGIDGYYISKESKTIYLIQSKFRTSTKNFEQKEIALDEILSMDIDRILKGETLDDYGNQYNGKILQLQREINNLEDIARYSYRVILLANLNNINDNNLRKLTGGYFCDIFNFERCYKDLVFPVISGTFYNASDVVVNIDLSNKNAGSKISYTVQTERGECEITVLFIPTIEIAKIMYKYKNSILKYNPRSYLGLEGQKVNDSITDTVLSTTTNEFALYNNGITILSDETYINERIGQKNKAQLIIKNPQIINGGQTSYTLSRIYAERNTTRCETIFEGKEVLVKIITLIENNNHENKLSLIRNISNATNQQTPVINADKISNDDLQIRIQQYLYEHYGLLYERKRGEFSDGIFCNYIRERDILERNLLFRMYYATNGNITKAREKKLFVNQNLTFEELTEQDKLDNAYFGYLCYNKINKMKQPNQRIDIDTYAKIRAMTILYKPSALSEYASAVDSNYEPFISHWNAFLEYFKDKSINKKTKINKKTGEKKIFPIYDYSKWYNSNQFEQDILSYFKNDKLHQYMSNADD